jgi:Tfp pilus assembly protein PilV
VKKLLRSAGGRLREQKGESIAEVLISLLISAVALVMLASMINTSARLVSDSRKKLTAYYAANEALTKNEAIGTTNTATLVLTYQNNAKDQFPGMEYQQNPQDERVVAYWG